MEKTEAREKLYTPPDLSLLVFETADIMELSEGSDENEGDWRPTGKALNIFDV